MTTPNRLFPACKLMKVSVTLLTYYSGRRCWARAAHRLETQAYQSGFFDSVAIWNSARLEHENPKGAETFFHLRGTHKQGDGLWSWKPVIIQHVLDSMDEGDILVYLDAGCSLNASELASQRMVEYLDLAREFGGLLFQQAHLEINWTKKSVLELFPERTGWYSGQLLGGVQILCKSPRATSYIERAFELAMHNLGEYLLPELEHDGESELIAHRHDQSIFSLVAKSFNLAVLKDETYFAPNWQLEGGDFPIWATRLCSGTANLSDNIVSRLRREIERRLPF